MSGSGLFPASEEHRYFAEIELLFNHLRGSASLLGPADWQLARSWWDAGVPLSVVRSTLEDVFRRRRERGDLGRIQGLRYCAPAVDNARRQLEALGYGESARPAARGPSLAERIDDLLRGLGSRREELEARIREALAGEPDAAQVEERLQALRDSLCRELHAGLEPEAAAEVDRELEDRLERVLAPLRSRLAADALQGAEERLRVRILGELLEVPPLSLFSSS